MRNFDITFLVLLYSTNAILVHYVKSLHSISPKKCAENVKYS